MPGKSHGLRSLVGYSPWGHKESDTTERLLFTFFTSLPAESQRKPKNTGVGSVSPLQWIFPTQETEPVSCIAGGFFTNWAMREDIYIYVCVCVCMCVCVCSDAQSCLTFCDSMDCSLLHPSVCGILQARILQWVVISSPRRSSWPRDKTWISYISCVSYIAGRFFTTMPPGKPINICVCIYTHTQIYVYKIQIWITSESNSKVYSQWNFPFEQQDSTSRLVFYKLISFSELGFLLRFTYQYVE